MNFEKICRFCNQHERNFRHFGAPNIMWTIYVLNCLSYCQIWTFHNSFTVGWYPIDFFGLKIWTLPFSDLSLASHGKSTLLFWPQFQRQCDCRCLLILSQSRDICEQKLNRCIHLTVLEMSKWNDNSKWSGFITFKLHIQLFQVSRDENIQFRGRF